MFLGFFTSHVIFNLKSSRLLPFGFQVDSRSATFMLQIFPFPDSLCRSTSLVAVVRRLCLHSSRAGGLSSAKYGNPGETSGMGWGSAKACSCKTRYIEFPMIACMALCRWGKHIIKTSKMTG